MAFIFSQPESRAVVTAIRRGSNPIAAQTARPAGPEALLRLQRLAGNAAVTGLVRPGPAPAVMRQVATPGSGGPNRCDDLLSEIIHWLNEVAQRFNDALDDRHDLFKFHRRLRDAHPEHGSWDGHQQRFNEDRRTLRERLTQWDDDDECKNRRLTTEQLRELAEAREFATKEWPARPLARQTENPEPEPSTRERIADALRRAGVPAWAVAAMVVLVIAALADPEPFTKVALIVGTAVAVLFFVLLGRRSDVPPTAMASAEPTSENDEVVA